MRRCALRVGEILEVNVLTPSLPMVTKKKHHCLLVVQMCSHASPQMQNSCITEFGAEISELPCYLPNSYTIKIPLNNS